jgi:hypothetical protein
MTAFGRIAKTNHGKIHRAAPPEISRSFDCSERDSVVNAEHGGDLRTTLGQPLKTEPPAVKAEFRNILDTGFNVREAGVLQGALISGELAKGGLRPRFDIPDEAYAAMTQFNQMLRGAKTGVLAIRCHHRNPIGTIRQQINYGHALGPNSR